MTDMDYWWVAVCALAAGNVAANPTLTAQLAWGGLLLVLLIVRMATSPQRQTTTTTPKPSDGIRDMLDAFRVAGFTDEQARELSQEAIRTQVRNQGGWRP